MTQPPHLLVCEMGAGGVPLGRQLLSSAAASSSFLLPEGPTLLSPRPSEAPRFLFGKQGTPPAVTPAC